MSKPTVRLKFCAISATVVLALSFTGAATNGVRSKPVSREIVEMRLRRYTGDNRQREMTLKQLFVEAGCDDQHISEQSVEGSKLPNVICVLPGTSDKVIIVGAHFDRVPDGGRSGRQLEWCLASALTLRGDQN